MFYDVFYRDYGILFIVKKNSNVVLISSKWESGVNYESAEV